MKILIIGLGNPGTKYKNNRHNAGRLFVDYLYSFLPVNFSSFKENKKLLAEIAEINDLQNKIILAKPTCYMNESGKSAALLKKFYRLKNEEIIIAQDDSDILLSQFKISINQNSAGHHGIDSIFHYLKTKNIRRIRIGIRPQEKIRQKAERLVLKNFSVKEKLILENTFKSIIESLKLKAEETK